MDEKTLTEETHCKKQNFVEGHQAAASPPEPDMETGKRTRWFERLLGIPAGSVVFLRPGGERAKPDETIGSLQPKNKAGLAPQK
jgi:hypothetical protein